MLSGCISFWLQIMTQRRWQEEEKSYVCVPESAWDLLVLGFSARLCRLFCLPKPCTCWCSDTIQHHQSWAGPLSFLNSLLNVQIWIVILTWAHRGLEMNHIPCVDGHKIPKGWVGPTLHETLPWDWVAKVAPKANPTFCGSCFCNQQLCSAVVMASCFPSNEDKNKQLSWPLGSQLFDNCRAVFPCNLCETTQKPWGLFYINNTISSSAERGGSPRAGAYVWSLWELWFQNCQSKQQVPVLFCK